MSGDYVRNTCGKQFVTKSGLIGSNWAVHNTVESPCTGCDKIFRNKKHLADQDHMSNTHAENERFSCDLKTGESACSYYSTTKSNLRAHRKRVHEKTINVIPPNHACGLYGYRINSKVSLSSHNKKCNRFLNQNSSITLVTSVTRSFLQRRF